MAKGSKRSTRGMPGIGAIADYWERERLLIACDWSSATVRCWCCGMLAAVQRCHIIPSALGGGDGAENLLLMCARCHREAPNAIDPSIMAEWFELFRAKPSADYRADRISMLYQDMYWRRPFSRLGRDPTEEEMREATAAAIGMVATHHGDGWLNESTEVASFVMAEEWLLNRLR